MENRRKGEEKNAGKLVASTSMVIGSGLKGREGDVFRKQYISAGGEGTGREK